MQLDIVDRLHHKDVLANVRMARSWGTRGLCKQSASWENAHKFRDAQRSFRKAGGGTLAQQHGLSYQSSQLSSLPQGMLPSVGGLSPGAQSGDSGVRRTGSTAPSSEQPSCRQPPMRRGSARPLSRPLPAG